MARCFDCERSTNGTCAMHGQPITVPADPAHVGISADEMKVHLDAALAAKGQLEVRYDNLKGLFDLLCSESKTARYVVGLESAIRRHRRDVWGDDGPVQHDHDQVLYAALHDSKET